MSEEKYTLYYWPGLPGRGEYVRLVFEEAGVPNVDIAKTLAPQEAVNTMMTYIKRENQGKAISAPPFITRGNLILCQTAAIGQYLGRKHNLAPKDEDEDAYALQLAMTLMDFAAEAHNVHHPITTTLTYEEQKEAAIQAAVPFCKMRIPKFFQYFEDVLARNTKSKSEWLVGDQITYCDLFLFQNVKGAEFAFPKAFGAIKSKIPKILALVERTSKRPNLAKYLASERRAPFSQHGLFRPYPELDLVEE